MRPDTSGAVGVVCASATSAQPGYAASNAIDGNPATIWHTYFSPYHNIDTTTDGRSWTLIASGSWADDASLKTATLPATPATQVRLKATSGDGGGASAAEITVSRGL